MKNLQSIVVTGASGIIGRNMIDYFKDDFIIFAIARRSRKEANVPYHPNLHWLQCDITNSATLSEAAKYINNYGGADFILHLAAFYDFKYEDNPAYQSINVDGTRNMLEFSLAVSCKRFIFASSIAACNFCTDGYPITEKTPPDADYEYARSKKLGEAIVKEYSEKIPCSVIRFAAVYSDWCEFAPLYKFLTSWLSKKIDSRIIGGKGQSAVPYIHVKDLSNMMKIIFEKTEKLPSFDIYNGSPNGSTSHREIYDISTDYFFGELKKPFNIPKYLAYPGLVLKKFLYHLNLFPAEPFEQYWMIKYIDLKLDVDSSYTQEKLGWEPTPRYHLTRRLIFLLEKMKSHPAEWNVKNEAALKHVAGRTNLILFGKMIEQKDLILAKIKEQIFYENPDNFFNQFVRKGIDEFNIYINAIYDLLMATTKSNDRSLLLRYIDEIAIQKFADGFEPVVLCATLRVFHVVIVNHLLADKSLSKFRQEIYDSVGLSLQIAQDEIEDLYEDLMNKPPIEKILRPFLLRNPQELQTAIEQLSTFYQVSPEYFAVSKQN